MPGEIKVEIKGRRRRKRKGSGGHRPPPGLREGSAGRPIAGSRRACARVGCRGDPAPHTPTPGWVPLPAPQKLLRADPHAWVRLRGCGEAVR